ncbi:MAG: hypothetical protein L0211_08425, partial [Planctomycetaceae bacterium]|nr:hypothetical protein [Planctomycetaceae bacterium]
RLVTGHDQPALGGVYKLSALRDESGQWQHRLKRSEVTIKVSDPGVLQVRRLRSSGRLLADALYDELVGFDTAKLVSPDGSQTWTIPSEAEWSDLLVPVMRRGRLTGELPEPAAIREFAASQLAELPEASRRLDNPQPYFVGHEPRLAAMKESLLNQVENQLR